MTTIAPGAVDGQAGRRQQAHHLLLPDRDRRGREECRRDRGGATASTACGSGISTLSVSLGIPGEFDNPKFTKAIDKVIAAARKHGKALGRLVPTVEQGIASAPRRLRFHLLFRRCLGAAQCAGRGGHAAPCRRQEEGLRRWRRRRSAWRCRAISRRPDGSPTFPDFDLAPLLNRRRRRDASISSAATRSAPSRWPISTR